MGDRGEHREEHVLDSSGIQQCTVSPRGCCMGDAWLPIVSIYTLLLENKPVRSLRQGIIYEIDFDSKVEKVWWPGRLVTCSPLTEHRLDVWLELCVTLANHPLEARHGVSHVLWHLRQGSLPNQDFALREGHHRRRGPQAMVVSDHLWPVLVPNPDIAVCATEIYPNSDRHRF